MASAPPPIDLATLGPRARVFKALGHPTRLFLVDRLAAGPECVCDLTEAVGADISTVSRHLALLRDAGLVEATKEGAKVIYRLRMPCVLDFFSCVEAVLDPRAGPSAAACAVPLRSPPPR